MKAACVQLRSGTDIYDNISAATDLIKRAADQGAEFIATPEMTHILQRSPKRLFAQITEESQDAGVQAFARLSAELNVHLLIGSLAIKTRDMRAANRSFLFDPGGEIIARYDKIHLFDVTVSRAETWKESNVYDRGDKAVNADMGGAMLGMSICYDLRFPALYRHYAQSGAQILSVPAAFTRPTGQAHWQSLLRARAIETGSFVIAAAQGGEHADGRATWGHSMIINPWGDIIAALDHDRPDTIYADIDLSEVEQARRKIPAWNYDPDFTR